MPAHVVGNAVDLTLWNHSLRAAVAAPGTACAGPSCYDLADSVSGPWAGTSPALSRRQHVPADSRRSISRRASHVNKRLLLTAVGVLSLVGFVPALFGGSYQVITVTDGGTI